MKLQNLALSSSDRAWRYSIPSLLRTRLAAAVTAALALTGMCSVLLTAGAATAACTLNTGLDPSVLTCTADTRSTGHDVGAGNTDIVVSIEKDALLENTDATPYALRLYTGDAGPGNNVTNFGWIRANADNSYGIHIDDSTDSANRITNFNNIEVIGDGAIGISLGGDNSASGGANIENTTREFSFGTIFSSTSVAGPLIEFRESGSKINVLNNRENARILVWGTAPIPPGSTSALDVSGKGIAVQGSGGSDHVRNWGTIGGTVRLGDGDDQFQMGPGSRYIGHNVDKGLDGGLGTDKLILMAGNQFFDPDGSVDLSRVFDLDNVDNFETLLIKGGSDPNFVTQWAVVGTSTIPQTTLEENAALWYGGLWGMTSAPTFDGDFEMEPGSIFTFGYDSTKPVDPMSVTGTLDLAGTLKFIATEDFDLTTPLRLPFIEAGTIAPDDNFDDLVDFNSLYAITTEVDWDDIDLLWEVTLVVTLDPQYEVGAQTPNQRSVADYLNTLALTGPTGQLNDLLNAVANLSGTSEYQAALDQLHPESYDAQASTTLATGNRFTQLLMGRQRDCIGSGENTRDARTGRSCNSRSWQPWVAAYGQSRSRDGKVGHVSFTDSGGGGAMGVDRRFGDKLVASTSIGTTYSNVDVSSLATGTLKTIDVGLAGGFDAGNWRVHGAATYGRGFHDVTRRISIPGAFGATGFSATGISSYSSDRMGARVDGEYIFSVRGYDLIPVASLDYAALLQPSLQESGAGDVGLAVDARTDHIVTLRTGFEVGTIFEKAGYWTDFLEILDGIWRPQASLRWRQVVSGYDRGATSLFQGAPTGTGTFGIAADDADRGFEVGVGFDFTPKLANRISIGAHYQAFVWEGVGSHDFGARVSFGF